jgi:hypothetical protein
MGRLLARITLALGLPAPTVWGGPDDRPAILSSSRLGGGEQIVHLLSAHIGRASR